MVKADPWIPLRRTAPGARVRLFCFAFAGGGASVYRTWNIEGVEVCPVQLPGRENRIAEPALQDMTAVADATANALARYNDMPVAFYGHSLGALVAFETARRLTPQLLIAGGCPAPQAPRREKSIHQLPEPEFLRAVSSLEGIPPAVSGDPEMMAFFSPLLRADLKVYETYRLVEPHTLPCPVTAFSGELDRMAPPDDMNAWEQVATGFRARRFPGGHFFLRDSEPEVIAAVRDEIAQRGPL